MAWRRRPLPMPRIVLATWSDGENGEWFRRPDEEHGFFGQFFSPYMEFCETGEFPVWPVHLSDYLRAYPPVTDIDLKTQALAGQMPGGTGGNEELLGLLSQVTARYWSLAKAGSGGSGPSRADLLQARELILRAEDSCYLLGGGASAQAMFGLLEKAEGLLNESPVNKAQTAIKKDKPPAKEQAAAEIPKLPVKVQAPAETPKPPVKTQAVAEIPEPPDKAQPAEAPKRPAKQMLAARKAAGSTARKGSRTTRKKPRKHRR